MKILSLINKKQNLIAILLILLFVLQSYSQESSNKFIHIEWEKNDLAKEYHLQISDSVKFLDILFQKKTKDSLIRLEPNPKYRYGRIAAVDEFGVRGEYSEIFEIEQRIVGKKAPEVVIPLPSNYLGENHSIILDLTEDKTNGWNTYYKINDGKWLTYQGGVQLYKEGLNLIQFYSEDRLGNREKIKTMDYILDREGPNIEVEITNTYEGKDKFTYTGKKSQITITISDLYSGFKSAKTFLRSANESIEMELNKEKSISIPKNFSEKTVELFVIATDRLGNTKTYSKFFKHDLTPPELNILTITKMDGNQRKISISQITANDSSSGVQNIFYSLNNSFLQAYLDPILISEPGEYELQIQAVDNVGNKSKSQYERIYIPSPPQKPNTIKR